MNNKFYIGIHKSSTPFDERYYGSGVGLKEALKKHGKQNFKVEVLEYCDSLEALHARERDLVTEEMVRSNDCYNRNIGGKGGSPKGHGLGGSRPKGFVAVRNTKTGETARIHKDDLTSDWVPIKRGHIHDQQFRDDVSARMKVRNKSPEAAAYYAKVSKTKSDGRVWWNNGVAMKHCVTPPDASWSLGMIKRSSKHTKGAGISSAF